MRTSELRNLASYREQDGYLGNMSKALILKKLSRRLCIPALCLVVLSGFSFGEDCKLASEMDPATKSALDQAALSYYQMAATGNTAALKAASIPAVSSDFTDIETAITKNKANFGPTAKVRNRYELDAPGNAPIQRAEFYCGVMNSPEGVEFVIPNLPPGRYGLEILEAQGGKEPMFVSFILQQYASGQWKLGGFFARPQMLAGHDGMWYLNQARSYKAKNQLHDAWLYYLAAWDLLTPVPFIGTTALDKISEEASSSKPPDMPTPEQPVQVPSAGGKTYSVTQMFEVPVQDGLALVVKYQVPDISNTAQAYQDNQAVMRALLAKYPELREAFTTIVARAVAPNGQDYGTEMAMKDIK